MSPEVLRAYNPILTGGQQGGITLGRFTLPLVAQRISEKILVWILILGALSFQVLVWQIPDVIGDSGTSNHLSRNLPPHSNHFSQSASLSSASSLAQFMRALRQ